MWQMTFEFTDTINLIKVPITVYAESYDEGFEKALSLDAKGANEDNLYLIEAYELQDEAATEEETEPNQN